MSTVCGEKQGGKRSRGDFIIQESIRYLITVLKALANTHWTFQWFKTLSVSAIYHFSVREDCSHGTLGGAVCVLTCSYSQPGFVQAFAFFSISKQAMPDWSTADIRAHSAVSFTQGRTLMFCTKGVLFFKNAAERLDSSSLRAWILAQLLNLFTYILCWFWLG